MLDEEKKRNSEGGLSSNAKLKSLILQLQLEQITRVAGNRKCTKIGGLREWMEGLGAW